MVIHVNSKFTISKVNERMLNQIKNSIDKYGSVILNVARPPTAKELKKLNQEIAKLGKKYVGKVKVISGQKALFEAVVSALN